jgi:hypothetical protein
MPRTSGRAIAVLVLGIVSLVLLCGYGVGIITAIVGLALAPGAKREIRESQGAVTGESFVRAGVVCSWITVGLFVVGLIAIALLIAFGAATSSTGTL